MTSLTVKISDTDVLTWIEWFHSKYLAAATQAPTKTHTCLGLLGDWVASGAEGSANFVRQFEATFANGTKPEIRIAGWVQLNQHQEGDPLTEYL